jgi:hypothetical protein
LQKEHLVIFSFCITNSTMEGASNLCGKTWQVLVRELVGKNAKEAICVGFPGFRANRAPLPGFDKLTQRQRLRRPSNPCRAWWGKNAD